MEKTLIEKKFKEIAENTGENYTLGLASCMLDAYNLAKQEDAETIKELKRQNDELWNSISNINLNP